MNNKKPRVFLGGTCNGSKWREIIIPYLKIEYFNPVVEDWTPECQAEEVRQREICDYCLYVITPKMQGVYSIAEVVDDSNKKPEKTLFCVLGFYGQPVSDGEFSQEQSKSLYEVVKMVQRNGSYAFPDLTAVVNFLNYMRPTW